MSEILNRIEQNLKVPSVINKFTKSLGEDKVFQEVMAMLSVDERLCQAVNNDFNSFVNSVIALKQLKLSLNKQLGQCAIIPYGNSLQVQIMKNGYINLAIRSGKIKTINSGVIKKDELLYYDKIRGDFGIDKDFIFREDYDKLDNAYYFASIINNNGFEKVILKSKLEIEKHRDKFSSDWKYKKSKGNEKNAVWFTNFDAMAEKTCLKQLINVFGDKTPDMQRAIEIDQAKIDANNNINYIDNEKDEENKINKEVKPIIENVIKEEKIEDEEW